MYEKLKLLIHDDALFMAVLLVLVGLVSFGLGRHSIDSGLVGADQKLSAGIIFIEKKPVEPIEYDNFDRKQVVVSKSGSKYYLLSCSGVGRIKEENKIFFESPSQAEAAGYTPAANCKGL